MKKVFFYTALALRLGLLVGCFFTDGWLRGPVDRLFI